MTESYRDQVVIEIRETADVTDPRVVDGYRVIVHPHGEIDLDWLNDQLEAAFMTTDEQTGELRKQPYVLTQTRKEIHTGAAGGQAHFLIEAAAMILSGATGAVIGNRFENIWDALRSRGYDVRHGKLETLTPDEIGDYGLRSIETTYSAPVSTLTLRSTGTNESGEYTASAVGPDGASYTITFVVRGGETQVQSSHRELP